MWRHESLKARVAEAAVAAAAVRASERLCPRGIGQVTRYFDDDNVYGGWVVPHCPFLLVILHMYGGARAQVGSCR